jgi:hypothetical protein
LSTMPVIKSTFGASSNPLKFWEECLCPSCIT